MSLNSPVIYASATEAAEYLTGRPGSENWNALQESAANALLGAATRMIDMAFQWEGEQTLPEQTLCWPRKNVRINGKDIPSATVPCAVKYAAIEQAFFLSSNSRTAAQNAAEAGIAAVSAGSMTLRMTGSAPGKIAEESVTLLEGYGKLRRRMDRAGHHTENGCLIRG